MQDATTLKNVELVMGVFHTFLLDPESYLYLTAIRGLAAVADVLPNQTIPVLTIEYSFATSAQRNS